MKMKKKEFYDREILNLLLENDSITIKEIAVAIQLSEKSVRNKIEEIDYDLRKMKTGHIEKKPRIGIWLVANQAQRLQIADAIQEIKQNRLLLNAENRLAVALKLILNVSRGIKLTTQKLSNELFPSLPTTLKVVKECEEWLKLFNIEMRIVRNKGIELDYSEESLRFAIKHYIYAFDADKRIEDKLSEFTPGIATEMLKKAIINTENEWGLEFTDQSFNEIFIYSALGVYRNLNTFSRGISISKDEKRVIEEYSEYSFSESIYTKLSEYFQIRIPSRENTFLAIQILCSRIIDTDFANNSIELFRKYDNKLRDFVEKIINVVSNVLNQDLTKDETLFHGLMIHIRPTIFRLRYEKKYSNEMYEYVRSEYKQTYRVSWIISVLFEEYYNLQVSCDEISFIALYIQSALERNEQPTNVLLVSQQSMAVNQLMVEKIKQYCPSIGEIEMVSTHDFRIRDYPDAGIILAAGKLDETIPDVIQIDPFLTERSLQDLNHKIRRHSSAKLQRKTPFDSICHTLFEPDLIFTNIKVSDKDELLKMLCRQLEHKGYVTQRYVRTVLERENSTTTSIGNSVSIPHGDQLEINEGKVVIATLEKPILWSGNDEVDVVFLLAVRMKTDFEIQKTQQFYKQYVKLVDTDANVKLLKQFDSNIELYKYLVQ